MKSKEIKREYLLDDDFDEWVKFSEHPHKVTFSGSVEVEDTNVEIVVTAYRAHLSEKAKLKAAQDKTNAANAALVEKANQEKQQALASMLITSGFNFDGYTITKYSGYISGDDAVSMDRPSHGFWGGVSGDVGADLLAGLSHIRRNALAELKEAAYALGCNAVIGVDFDYLTLDPQTSNKNGGTIYLPYVFGVTANGNAVIIEKN